jgi:hypothetical protein
MPAITEDTELIRFAMEYVAELYRELTKENGAPNPGTQNQAVEFILADPELREAITAWGRATNPDEAMTMPPHRLPIDRAYRRIRSYLEGVMQEPVSEWIEQSCG